MSTINIALTSYPKRIKNCVAVINSVLDNTLLPDRIYLTLSHLEFPNWEEDIPKELYRLIMTSNRVVLNWVEENTKSFKKVFPILPYLDPDDIIIPIDDDMLLPRDFIEARMKDFHANGDEHPITSNLCQTINMDNMVFTVYSLVQKKMLNGYEKFLVPTVLNTCNDDRTYLYLCHLNGYKLVPCTRYCYTQGESNGVEKLPIAPRSDYTYDVGPKFDQNLAPFIAELSEGKTIGECFGLFNQVKKMTRADRKAEKDAKVLSIMPKSGVVDDIMRPGISPDIEKMFQYNAKTNIHHDLVYVLGKGSKYNNMEIKISITSMLKFCSHWIGNIYIVGENPGIHHQKVTHIYAHDITRGNKDGNIIHKLLTAIWKIPTLTDNFLFCSDDILVTRKTNWEDFSPRYVFEYSQDNASRKRLYNESKGNSWDILLLKTLDRFVGKRGHIYFYEPHIFAPINKRYFKEMCKQIDYIDNKNVMIMSLWFNWLNLKKPQKRFDHQSVFSENIPDMSNLARHLTFNDNAFAVKRFREQLVNLVAMDEFKRGQ